MNETIRAQNKYNFNEAAVLRSGVVLPKEHPTDPSAYYVYFGEKTASDANRADSGVWCSNNISSFTRYRDATNNPISYGSYTPIQPYTPVNVLMSNGGIGNPTIIGLGQTNTSVPDHENIHGLHVLGLTPNGSTIQMDDKTGSINIMYDKGKTAVHLSNEAVSMEIMDGAGGSANTANTSISLRKGGISFKLPEAQMQFDESGFAISFDDGGTSVKITKKGVVMEGMEIFKVASDEQASIKASKLTLQGTKDASLTASELKVGGKQLTNITGTQINIESVFATTIKGVAINLFAWNKIQQFATLHDITALGSIVRTAPIITEAAIMHATKCGTFSVGAALVALDSLVITNTGLGLALSAATYASNKAAMVAMHASLTAYGTALLVKALPMTITNKVMADTLAGTSEPAMEPVGNASGARDKNDKKSYGAVSGTKFAENRSVMQKYSIVPPLVAQTAVGQSSSYAYSATGGTSPLGTPTYASTTYGYSDNVLGVASRASASKPNSDEMVSNIQQQSGRSKTTRNSKSSNRPKTHSRLLY